MQHRMMHAGSRHHHDEREKDAEALGHCLDHEGLHMGV
jgi:hypothetical protein